MRFDGTIGACLYQLLDLVRVTDRLGRTRTLTYDAARQLTQQTDALQTG